MLKVRDFLATAESALISGVRASFHRLSPDMETADNKQVEFSGYSESEAKAIAVRLCEEVLGVKSYQWVLEPDMEVPVSEESRLIKSLHRLCEGEPLQYVFGYADFCGFQFRVGPSVLIPRPETEELCRLVVREAAGMVGVSPAGGFFQDGSSLRGFDPVREGGVKRVRIMDLCTGSGCIAWTLALLLPSSEVIGVDVSEEALDVARTQPLAEDAARRGAIVPQFILADILSDTCLDFNFGGVSRAVGSSEKTAPEGGRPSFSEAAPYYDGDFDIIVSNPPYIRLSEKDALPENVKNHEPDLALFVPDDDPLLFYRAIANFSVKRLRLGGRGFVEINEALGEPTAAIFSSAGFSSVRLLRDFRAKFRFVSFKK